MVSGNKISLTTGNSLFDSNNTSNNGHLHNIWMTETKEDANKVFDLLLGKYGVKYQLPKAITGVKFQDGLKWHDEIEKEAA